MLLGFLTIPGVVPITLAVIALCFPGGWLALATTLAALTGATLLLVRGKLPAIRLEVTWFLAVVASLVGFISTLGLVAALTASTAPFRSLTF